MKCQNSWYFKDNSESSEEFWIETVCPSLYFDWSTSQWGSCIDSKWDKWFPKQESWVSCNSDSLQIKYNNCDPLSLGWANYGENTICTDWNKGYYFSSGICSVWDSTCKEWIGSQTLYEKWTKWESRYYPIKRCPISFLFSSVWVLQNIW